MKLSGTTLEQGYSLRELPLPDLVGQKRKLAAQQGTAGGDEQGGARAGNKKSAKGPRADLAPSRWLFVGKLPLTVTAAQVRDALAGAPAAGAEVTLCRLT